MAKPSRALESPANTPKKAKRGGPKTPLTTKQKWLRALKWTGIGVLVMAVLGASAFGIAYATIQVPDPNKDFQTNNTVLYYRDGSTELGTLAIQNRVSIPYAEMPQTMKDSIVALENRTFWTDPGISIQGIGRAIVGAITGKDAGGGSTLTQQYIKVLYLTQDKTMIRKLREIILAIKIGNTVSKEQILEGYLNTVYYGRGAYGIQAASKAFFDIDAKDLTLPQAAALAAMVNQPSALDPAQGEKQAAALLARYRLCLDALLDTKKISQAEHDTYYAALPEFPAIPASDKLGGPKGFLIQMVTEELKSLGFSAADINGGGLRVTSTFDAADQEAAVSSIEATTAKAAGKKDASTLHGALVSLDVATGEVLALYGGPDYVASSRNWANTDRNTGSTFKAFAVVAALRQGWTLADELKGSTFTPKGDGVPVHNAGNEQFGTVDLQTAITHSVNTAFVDLVTQLKDGPAAVMQAAKDAGLNEALNWDANNRIALGTAQATPLEMANAYATFDNGGKFTKYHFVKEVKDANGQVLYTATPTAEQKIEPNVAQDLTYALTKVTQDGTGATASQLAQDVAGKTGTVDVNGATTAAWFIGYTKQICTAVMYVAGDDGEANLNDFSGSGFYGGGYPTQAWLSYMKVAMKDLPNVAFDGPTNRTSTQQPTAVDTSAPQDTQTNAAPPPQQSTSAAAAPTTSAAAPTSSAAPVPSDTSTSAAAPPTQAKGNPSAATTP